MKKILAAGIAIVLGVPAFAADMALKAPVYKAVEPGYNWTGWYGGVNAGLGISQTNVSLAPIGSAFIDVAERSGAGFAGGVQAGLNWQFAPNWVVGIEGDIGYLGIDRSFRDWNSIASYGVKTDGYGTMRGRLGYSSGPSLFYATGGAAFVSVRNNFDNVVVPAFLVRTKIASGWTAGGGIETMLGGNWSAKAEYLYIDAGGQDIFNPDFNDGAGLTARFDNRFHVYRYGLNYKFGGPPSIVGAMPARNWTGFYAGVNAGAGLAQSRADTNKGLTGAVDVAGTAFNGGVQAGYNWQFTPNWVIGVEGDIVWFNADRSVLEANREVAFGIKTDWYGTLRGRLGYSTGPALLYVTGGAAFVDVKNAFDNVDATPAIRASASKTVTGWAAGGGIEAALSPNWTAKTEYLYVDAGSQDVFNPDLGGGLTTRFDNRFHVFRYGVNYKFGG
ncbi:MAG: outer membrane protein [Afipia sp.]